MVPWNCGGADGVGGVKGDAALPSFLQSAAAATSSIGVQDYGKYIRRWVFVVVVFVVVVVVVVVCLFIYFFIYLFISSIINNLNHYMHLPTVDIPKKY